MSWLDTLGAAPGSTQIPGSTAASSLAGVRPQLNPGTLQQILSILGKIGKGVGQTAMTVGRQLPYAGPLVQAGEYGVLQSLGKTGTPWAQGNWFAMRDQLEQERKAKEALAMQQGRANLQTTENENLLFPQKQREAQMSLDELQQRMDENALKIADLKKELSINPGNVRAQNELEKIRLENERLAAQTETERKQGELYGAEKDWYTRRPTTTSGGRANVLSVTEIDRQAAAYADRMYPKTWSGAARTPEWWTAYKEKSAELEGANKYPEVAGSGLGEGGSETDAQETPEESLANQVYDTYLAPIMPENGSILEQQHAARQGLTKAIAAGVIKQGDVVYRLIVKQYKLPQ